MPRFRGLFILLFALSAFCSGQSVQNVTGTYHINFPVQVMFSIKLKLNPDSSFELVSKGDLTDDSVSGTYRVFDNRVFLLTIWNKTGPYRYSREEATPKIYRYGRDTIYYQSLFYSSDDKLFFANLETGKKIKKAKKYHERKKYWLFGSHYYNEPWYLKRMDTPAAP